MKDPAPGIQWALGPGDEAVMRRLEELEKPYMIREEWIWKRADHRSRI